MLPTILRFLLISVVITAAIPLVLLVSQPLRKGLQDVSGLEFGAEMARDIAPLPLDAVTLRDGARMPLRRVAGPEGAPLVVLIHGSGWHGGQFDGLAPQLGAVADVLVPDLRGHGRFEGTPGDIDHMGQLEEDLVDLIAAEAKPGQKVVLAGHSSGGGLVVRFAGGEHGAQLSGAVLLAPFLKHDAPTARADSTWAWPLTRRIVALSMLNGVGIHALDGVKVIQFAMPRAVLEGPQGELARTAYSWRLNTSYAPRSDYRADLAALPPFMLIAGVQDEAFHADRYEGVIAPVNAGGAYHLLPGVGHLGLVHAPQTAALMRAYLSEL